MSIKRWKLGLKRCNCVKCESAITFEQTEENCGWVMWEHHKEENARLKAEVERLRVAGEDLAHAVRTKHGVDFALEEWDKEAKEGRQP